MHELGSSLKSIIESTEMGWLPSPPHIFNKLLDICHDPDSSIDDLTDLISTDAVLTCKLIMAVNSASFSISQPVNNLKQAATLLGHDRVKTMVLTSFKPAKGTCSLLHLACILHLLCPCSHEMCKLP